MDDYLESLVLKSELGATDVEISEPIESEVAQEEPVANVTEESIPVTFDAEPAEGSETPEIQFEPEVKEEVKEQPKPATSFKSQASATECKGNYEVDQTYYVENIKIYKTPDSNQVTKTYTGNVVFKGQIEHFFIIEYVRHGFGIVRGYTLSLG